jgi:hypothetical protein
MGIEPSGSRSKIFDCNTSNQPRFAGERLKEEERKYCPFSIIELLIHCMFQAATVNTPIERLSQLILKLRNPVFDIAYYFCVYDQSSY